MKKNQKVQPDKKLNKTKPSLASLNKEARQTLEEAEVITQVDNVLADVNKEWDEKAADVLDEAKVLTQAVNAADKPFEQKPFVPDQHSRKLFDEINALVEAQNDVDDGFLESAKEHLKHMEDDWNLQHVLDDKIEEEAENEDEQRLRNRIIEDFEEQL